MFIVPRRFAPRDAEIYIQIKDLDKFRGWGGGIPFDSLRSLRVNHPT